MVQTYEIKKKGVTESQDYALRLFVNQQAATMSVGELVKTADLLEAWAANMPYAVGDIRAYSGDVYKCVQAHTSQTGWEPPATPAMWQKQAGENPQGVPVWIQPLGAHDAYDLGAQVCYPDADGDVYVSTVDANVWQPGVYGWEKQAEGGEPSEPEQGEGTETEEFPAWVQPTGAHDAYSVGDKVSHNGQNWVSTVNANTWEPGVYGWDVYSA